MFVWAALFLSEGIFLRGFNREARNWLYATGAIFIGLGLLGDLLPLFDLIDTNKRGLFKILPFMLLYMANNEGLLRLSAWISLWENAVPAVQTPGKIQQKKGAEKALSTPGGKKQRKRG